MKNQKNLPLVRFKKSPKPQLTYSLLRMQAPNVAGLTKENGWRMINGELYKAVAIDKDTSETIYLKVKFSLDTCVYEDYEDDYEFEIPNLMEED